MCACIEGVDRRVEFQAKRLLGVQWPRNANQTLGEVGIDLPQTGGVSVGQRVARNRLATKAHVMQPSGLRSKVNFNVAQGFLAGQLGKCHSKELIQTGEVFDLVLALVVGHTAAKRAQRQVEHELRKYELALVHGGFGRKSAKNSKSDF